jgi:hypothetical protein
VPRYLLDTNVLSEMARPRPEPLVVEWVRRAAPQEVATSVMVVGEILVGILGIEGRDPARAAALRDWLRDIEATHLVLPIDEVVIREWAALRAAIGDDAHLEDMLIAATALVHRMTVITRNTGDFRAFGVPTLNPWSAG